jgi:hypothetical protein
MIVKAVVESIIDTYRVRIRIPLTDRDKASNIHTSDSDLDIATICTLPNCRPNIKVGDIVFVAMEKTYPVSQPVILGVLFRENLSKSFCDLVLDDLVVNSMCSLPRGTSIGELSYQELRRVAGVTDNVQLQLNSLSERISALESLNKPSGGVL